jgi:hypothetical protein
VLFDIYQGSAAADLNGDGTNEELTFQAGASNSKLTVNGTELTVNVENLGQVFAITDVDTADKYKEIVFCEKYNATYGSDPEVKPTAFLYWWNGTKLIQMGSIGDAGFDGAWRSTFKAADHFDGAGLVAGYSFTGSLTKIYYTGHFEASGSSRKLVEENYAAKVLWTPNDLVLKKPCLLLAHGDSTYFGSTYSGLWDYASGEYTLPREPNPGGAAYISIIAQTGETVKIVGVLGQNWVKLKTSDGFTGWIKVVENKVQGYNQVMHIVAPDIFNGLASAG